MSGQLVSALEELKLKSEEPLVAAGIPEIKARPALRPRLTTVIHVEALVK